MGDSAIQWTEKTWNPVVGCTQVSPGCAHCYAKDLHDKRHRAHLAGKQVAPQYAVPFETVQLKPERLTAPLGWRSPKRVFVNSVADLFHDDVPDGFIDRVFAVMAIASQHTFQVLTKRPARMLLYVSGLARSYDRLEAAARSVNYTLRFEGLPLVPWPLPNVWLGASVENQRWADERIRLLRRTSAAVRFLSVEPQLGAINFAEAGGLAGVQWVIVGGESGSKARPFDVQWARDIVAQCRATGVVPFVKQLGARPVVANDSGADGWPGASIPFADEYEPHHQGELAPLKLRDGHGGDMAEWPEELRVREFPASGVRA